MRNIEQLLHEVPALAGLPEAGRALIAGCATNCVYEPGDQLLREGEPANTFYVIRRGSVALDTFLPPRGAVTIETIEDGDLLGWSWLFPPYRNMFNARAVTTTHAIAFDGACLRGKLDDDPALGYATMKLFASVMVERLQATRLRLLDIYGMEPGDRLATS